MVLQLLDVVHLGDSHVAWVAQDVHGPHALLADEIGQFRGVDAVGVDEAAVGDLGETPGEPAAAYELGGDHPDGDLLPRPLNNLRAGGDRPPSTRCGPIPMTSSGLRSPRMLLRCWLIRGNRWLLFTRCGPVPPRSTSPNPSSTSRRSRRWVPLLGMELATILIALLPYLLVHAQHPNRRSP